MSTCRHFRDGESAQDAFRARMEAQRYQIERYRRAKMQDKGELLSLDDAALEWIERYAEAFARDGASL